MREKRLNTFFNQTPRWGICMMTSFDYNYQNALIEARYSVQYFFPFREESLARDTNVNNKDCSEMHSGSRSQMTPNVLFPNKDQPDPLKVLLLANLACYHGVEDISSMDVNRQQRL